MKVKAPSLLKKIIEALSSKTNELRIRLTIFFLLHKNIDRTSLAQSLQTLISHHPKKKNDDVLEDEQQGVVDESKASLLMNYNKATNIMGYNNNTNIQEKDEELNEDYYYYYDNKKASVDLTNALFKESEAEMEMEAVEGGGVVVDAVEEGVVGEAEVVVEEEDIDQAADMFIQRFKRQIMLQKQRSLERQERLLVSHA